MDEWMSFELSSTEWTTLSTEDTLPPYLNLTKPIYKAQLRLYDILIPCLGAIIIILNLAVVISSGLIVKKGSQPRATYLFLGNVAMCDLVTGVAVVLGQAYPIDARNQFICGCQIGFIVSSTLASIYSVGLIAIDRYLYIIHGLQYQRWVYPMRARVLILSTWIIGCVVGFLPVMGWSGDTQNGKICWFIKLVPGELIMITCLIGLIPIIIVIVLYSIILYHAIKKVLQLRRAATETNNTNNVTTISENKLRIFVGRASTTNTSQNGENSQTSDTQTKMNYFRRMFVKKPQNPIDLKSPSKSKAIKVVLFVTGSFVITWVPYFVASFIYVNCNENETPERCKSLRVLIASPLAILGFCNSLLNPVIYAWWHKGFRTSVKNLIKKKKPNNVRESSSGTKSTNQSSSKKVSSDSLSDQQRNEIILQNVDLTTHL